jgi:hypothetical protein
MIYAVAIPFYLWVFWGAYVLVMGLYRAHLEHRLTWFTYILAAPFIGIGVLLDVLANIFIASFIFLEIPREMLVTTRLVRMLPDVGWRGGVAQWVCASLLDTFDPSGKHCR